MMTPTEWPVLLERGEEVSRRTTSGSGKVLRRGSSGEAVVSYRAAERGVPSHRAAVWFNPKNSRSHEEPSLR